MLHGPPTRTTVCSQREQSQLMSQCINFSSVQDGIAMCSEKPICTPPPLSKWCLWNSSNVHLTDNGLLSHPFKEDRLALPFSTPLSSRWSIMWCPWLCDHRNCLNLLNISDLPRTNPLVKVALPTSLSAQSFPSILACPGQYTHWSFWRWMLTIDTLKWITNIIIPTNTWFLAKEGNPAWVGDRCFDEWQQTHHTDEYETWNHKTSRHMTLMNMKPEITTRPADTWHWWT